MQAVSTPTAGNNRSLVCHLCGSRHPLAALPSHLQRCTSARAREQSKLPPEFRTDPPLAVVVRSAVGATPGTRRLDPTLGSVLIDPGVPGCPVLTIPGASSPMGARLAEEYNETALALYRSSLPRCTRCALPFPPSRIRTHMACCRATRPHAHDDYHGNNLNSNINYSNDDDDDDNGVNSGVGGGAGRYQGRYDQQQQQPEGWDVSATGTLTTHQGTRANGGTANSSAAEFNGAEGSPNGLQPSPVMSLHGSLADRTPRGGWVRHGDRDLNHHHHHHHNHHHNHNHHNQQQPGFHATVVGESGLEDDEAAVFGIGGRDDQGEYQSSSNNHNGGDALVDRQLVFAPQNPPVLRTPAVRNRDRQGAEPTPFGQGGHGNNQHHQLRRTPAATAVHHPYVHTPADSYYRPRQQQQQQQQQQQSEPDDGYVVCHLCGSEYPWHRMPVHQAACRDAFVQNVGARPPSPPDIPLPRNGSDTEGLQRYNARALEISEDSLGVISRAAPSLLSRPCACHTCGVWMSLRALSGHSAACENERERRFAMLPPEIRPATGARFPVSVPPPVHASDSDIDAYNEISVAHFEGRRLEICQGCQRAVPASTMASHIGSEKCRPLRPQVQSQVQSQVQVSSVGSAQNGYGFHGRTPVSHAKRVNRTGLEGNYSNGNINGGEAVIGGYGRVTPAQSGLSGVEPQLVCFLCGLHFPSRSLHLHHADCLDAHMTLVESGLPRELWRSAEAIEDDMEPDPIPDLSLAETPEAAERSAALFNESNLARFQQRFARCPGCGRRFHLPRLVTHFNGCKGGRSHNRTRPPAHRPSFPVPRLPAIASRQQVYLRPPSGGTPGPGWSPRGSPSLTPISPLPPLTSPMHVLPPQRTPATGHNGSSGAVPVVNPRVGNGLSATSSVPQHHRSGGLRRAPRGAGMEDMDVISPREIAFGGQQGQQQGMALHHHHHTLIGLPGSIPSPAPHGAHMTAPQLGPAALSNLLSQREAQDARIAALSEEREELVRRVRELESHRVGGSPGDAQPRRQTVHGNPSNSNGNSNGNGSNSRKNSNSNSNSDTVGLEVTKGTKGKKSRSCNIL